MSLTHTQIRFLRLHQRHFVNTWKELFQGGMLRAATERGTTATVSALEALEMAEAGLITVEQGAVNLTAAGWAV